MSMSTAALALLESGVSGRSTPEGTETGKEAEGAFGDLLALFMAQGASAAAVQAAPAAQGEAGVSVVTSPGAPVSGEAVADRLTAALPSETVPPGYTSSQTLDPSGGLREPLPGIGLVEAAQPPTPSAAGPAPSAAVPTPGQIPTPSAAGLALSAAVPTPGQIPTPSAAEPALSAAVPTPGQAPAVAAAMRTSAGEPGLQASPGVTATMSPAVADGAGRVETRAVGVAPAPGMTAPQAHEVDPQAWARRSGVEAMTLIPGGAVGFVRATTGDPLVEVTEQTVLLGDEGVPVPPASVKAGDGRLVRPAWVVVREVAPPLMSHQAAGSPGAAGSGQVGIPVYPAVIKAATATKAADVPVDGSVAPRAREIATPGPAQPSTFDALPTRTAISSAADEVAVSAPAGPERTPMGTAPRAEVPGRLPVEAAPVAAQGADGVARAVPGREATLTHLGEAAGSAGEPQDGEVVSRTADVRGNAADAPGDAPDASQGEGTRHLTGGSAHVPDAPAESTRGAEGARPAGYTHIRVEELLRLVEHQARVHAGPEGTTIQLSLEPEHLGQVKLEVTWQGDAVAAHFGVETPEARALIENGLRRLEEALRDQGIAVASLQVALSGARDWGGGHRRAEEMARPDATRTRTRAAVSVEAARPRAPAGLVDFLA